MLTVGSMNGSRVDTTPTLRGKIGGSPWQTVAAGNTQQSVGTTVYCPTNTCDFVRVSYEARGRRVDSSDPGILLVGTAVVTNVAGSAVISEVVDSTTSTRMRLFAGGPVVSIVCDAHLTEDWEFQTKIAYDLPNT